MRSWASLPAPYSFATVPDLNSSFNGCKSLVIYEQGKDAAFVEYNPH